MCKKLESNHCSQTITSKDYSVYTKAVVPVVPAAYFVQRTDIFSLSLSYVDALSSVHAAYCNVSIRKCLSVRVNCSKASGGIHLVSLYTLMGKFKVE